MGNSTARHETSMGDSRPYTKFFNSRKFPCSGISRDKHNTKNHKHRKSEYKFKYLLAIIFLSFSPKTLANTVSSPSASCSGTVINNGYQTINGGFPTMTYGAGIQCQTTTLAITPFVTKGQNYSFPKIHTTKTNIYDLAEDAEGNLINPGKILYTSEQPRIDQTTFNFNYGITMSLQVPLGRKFNNSCIKAAEAQIAGQQFALEKAKLEANLARLKICAEQLKLGAKYIGEDAITCKNVVLTKIPNQIVPHSHEFKLKQ